VGKNESSDTVVSVVEVPVEAVRGEILDRNGYPLATNKKVNKIIFNYLSFPKEYEERNKIILELISLFDKNKTEWNDNLPIEVTKKGKLRFAKDKDNEVSYLKSEAFLDLNYYADVEDCFNALVSKYKLEDYSVKDARNIASVYYSMVKNGFNTGRNYEFATEVSSALVSAIKERSDHFPGVDVQVSIITQTIDNAVVVPVEVICIDGEEVFVYVLEDGKAVKRDVELGISSDTHYQILSGITKDDILIKNTFGLEEGVSVES
jgi:cell division protein FtsI/penicillin-binding protein 2